MLTRRHFLQAASSAAFALTARGARAADRLNVVFMYIDDMGYADPSCFGNPMVKTPNIDRLAAEGIRLTNYYSNSPICSPSRVAVTTGQYPGRWNIHSYLQKRQANRNRGMADWLDAKAVTDGKLFKGAGYATAHFGKWHMGGGRDVDDAPEPSAYGYDEHLVAFEGMGPHIDEDTTPKHLWTQTYVDHGIDFIERNRDKPFFLRLFPNDVHDPHLPKEGEAAKWADVTSDNTWQDFFAVLVEMDRQLGRLLDVLDKLGLAEKTLVLFASDNGPTDWPRYYTGPGSESRTHPPGFTGEFYGRKWSLYEGGIHMPFVARLKGRIPAGAVNTTSIMAGIDILPTACGFAGIPLPADYRPDGIDMGAALLGKPYERPKPIFWQYGGGFANLMPGNKDYWSPSLATRDGNWKLLMNADGSGLKLYNLDADIGEKNNLAEARPEVAQRLRKQIETWYNDLGYPEKYAALPKKD